jgi:hypothetical protein
MIVAVPRFPSGTTDSVELIRISASPPAAIAPQLGAQSYWVLQYRDPILLANPSAYSRPASVVLFLNRGMNSGYS